MMVEVLLSVPPVNLRRPPPLPVQGVSTAAGTGVSAGVSSSGRDSLPVAAEDVDGPDLVGPQEEVDGAGKILHRYL